MQAQGKVAQCSEVRYSALQCKMPIIYLFLQLQPSTKEAKPLNACLIPTDHKKTTKKYKIYVKQNKAELRC